MALAVSCLLLLLLLSACDLSVDAEQARLCRLTIPAVDKAASGIVVRSAASGPVPRSVRVAYDAVERGTRRSRSVTCRFGAEGLALSKVDLVGLEGPEGRLSPAAIYLLKHYYLETGDAAAADPGPPDPAESVPRLSAGTAYLLQQLLLGLPAMAIYGLMAAAYALVFGLVGRINLAFGEIAAIGAAAAGLAVALYSTAGSSLLLPGLALGIAVAIAAGALHNAVVGRLSFVLVPAWKTQASLIATVGFSLALSEYLRLAAGAKPAWIPPVLNEPRPVARAGDFVVTVTPIALANAAIGLAVAGTLVGALRFSRFGREWRALSEDRLAASLFGVDSGRVTTRTLLVGGALAGLSGALLAVQFGALGFADGFQFGLKALAAAILGGVGSVAGSVAGGLAIGLFETLWSSFLPIEGRDLALYVVLIVAIVARAGGALDTERSRAHP